jgi:hypothetical protein
MVAPSADGLNLVVDQHHPEKVRQLLDTGSNDTEARQVRSARRQDTPSTEHCRRWACHGLEGGPASPGSTTPLSSGSGGAVPPAQLPPAARPAIRQSHRPLLLDPTGRSSPPWLATAGPVPPPTARYHAPDTAAHHGCRTAARRCGRPDSANRRSARYTDVGRRASASRYICGPCRTLSRAEWRSPRAGGSSGRTRRVTTLGLVARLRPTRQAGGHGQVGAASRSTVLPAGRARRARSGSGRRPGG